MLPVCSVVPSCSSPYAISFHVGTKAISSVQKLISNDRSFFNNRECASCCESSLQTHASRTIRIPAIESLDKAGSIDSSIFSQYLDSVLHGFSSNLDSEPDTWGSVREINGCYPVGGGANSFLNSAISKHPDHVFFSDIMLNLDNASGVEAPTTSIVDTPPPPAFSEDNILNLHDSLDQASNVTINQTSSESVSTSMKSMFSDNFPLLSNTFGTANNGISDLRESLENVLSGIQESVDTSYNFFTLSIKDNVKGVTQSFENVIDSLFYSVEDAKQQAGGKLVVFSSDFKGNMYRAGMFAVNILRHAVVSLEDSLLNVTTFVVYSYESTKTLLPVEARNVLNISEEKTTEILKPVVGVLQQVSVIIELLERSVGLDPSDPIVPFTIFLGTSATLGISYWVLQYGGYCGDLSPEATFNLLKNEDNTVLIDVRPKDQRESEGIPDLRRAARFKYASVSLPKVDGAEKKLLKNAKEIDDALLSLVIRNLKMVHGGSKVIIMDAGGEQSKGIARSLRKLGMKRSYLVQGGFQSWVKSGLRIKQLKTETTFTILNEEAEAILDEIRPTPTLIFGSGLGVIAAIYALLEWERTLQLIGFVGLGQTLYQRVASYEDSEDFKKDLRLLLIPVTFGAQVFSWAAGKLEPDKIGLPTSPSSTAVRDRVLQAAAKHESQPSDSDEAQPLEPTSQAGENLDLSEA